MKQIVCCVSSEKWFEGTKENLSMRYIRSNDIRTICDIANIVWTYIANILGQ